MHRSQLTHFAVFSLATLAVLTAAAMAPFHAGWAPFAGAAAAGTALVSVLLLYRAVTTQARLVQRQLESERALAERYQELFENASDMVYTLDLEGRLTSLNRAGEELSGFRLAEKDGLTIFDLVASGAQEGAQRLMLNVVRGGVPVRGELEFRTARGTHLVVEIVERIIKRQGRPVGVHGIARDVTAHKRAEIDMRNARGAAEAASRSKSQFLANMSHEIRTPMNGIVGMTDLALDTELTTEQREYLVTVKSCAEALLRLIEDVLDFSKIEAGKLGLDPIDFPLRQTVEDIRKMFGLRAAEKGIALAFHVGADVPDRLLGDPGRLQQVIVNLVGNALKFTPQGRVELNVDLVASGNDGTRIRFAVTDTGIGIPADKARMIFDAFSQADESTARRFGGTGLGLTISARLTQMMGGTLEVETEPGKGSRFFFTARFDPSPLTRLARQPEVEMRPAELPAPAGAGGLRVLLVEDNLVNQRLTEHLLQKRGHAVVLVGDGEQAIAAASRERFDLILMDVQMPGINGFEATTGIRALEQGTLRRTPIVAITAHAMAGDRERCLEAGMDAYISKPVRAYELYAAVETLARRRPAAVPAVAPMGAADFAGAAPAVSTSQASAAPTPEPVVRMRVAPAAGGPR